jgi:hypothetical protein
VATISQNVSSLQYVRVQVTAIVGGNTAYNPSSDAVSFGFAALGANPNIAPTTWYAGSWETDAIGGVSSYIARCLVGPAGTYTPVRGNYLVWLKVTDSPEIPVLPVGQLNILGA